MDDYLYVSDKAMQTDEMTEAPNGTDYQSSATPRSNIVILPTTPRAILFAANPAASETNYSAVAPSFTSLTSVKPSPIGKPSTCADVTSCQVLGLFIVCFYKNITICF